MKINKEFITEKNSYAENHPVYIVIHQTGNPGKGANARAHAKALQEGSISGMSWHYAVDDSDTAYQCLKHDRGAYHVGVNYGGRLFGTVNNRNSICIESCIQDGYQKEQAFQNLVELTKRIMKETGIKADKVISHYDVCAKNCPAQIRDAGRWSEFKKLITGGSTGTAASPSPSSNNVYYRVRKAWSDPASQLGAYTLKENAVAGCPLGYCVFDEKGKLIYENLSKKGLRAAELKGFSEANAIKKVAPLYMASQKKTGMLASVGIAQFCLESGYGSTALAQKANNVHGMKAALSGNSWAGSIWDGKSTVSIKTVEQDPKGNAYYIQADFRKYPDIETSIGDRAAYFKGAMNGSKKRYPNIDKEKDYKKAARIIKDGGYATDAQYAEKIVNLIQRWNLTQYDAKASETAAPAFEEYTVKVTSAVVNIRTGPGTNYKSVGYTGTGTFTIVQERNVDGAKWGLLKSYKKNQDGWIALYLNAVKKQS